jgi:hypothetical protein
LEEQYRQWIPTTTTIIRVTLMVRNSSSLFDRWEPFSDKKKNDVVPLNGGGWFCSPLPDPEM